MKKVTKVKIIPYGRQTITKQDISSVVAALKSDFLTQGPAIERFEKSVSVYCGAKYAVAFSSGTAALHGACFAADIGTGDEVITTPLTFAASANCILYCGGTPVFADIQRALPLIDPAEIEKKVTKRTKAIISVDYSGIPADYEKIQWIAKKNHLLTIADAAHSLGATFQKKKVGMHADMTVFSFHPVKLITTGEGGMVVTNNKTFYERLKLFRTHGITKEKRFLQNKGEGGWYYEMQELGFNYRMTDIQAALGHSQMKKITRFIRRRTQIANYYIKAFSRNKRLTTLPIFFDRTSAWHLFPIQVVQKKRKEIFTALHKNHIKVQVHYIPVHLHPYYKKRFGYKKGDFPNAETFYNQEISLPIYPELTDGQASFVVRVVVSLTEKLSS